MLLHVNQNRNFRFYDSQLFFFPPCSDDDDVIQEENLEFDSGFGNIIVVDNLPVVPKEKFDKLVTVVRKIYSQIGAIKEDGLWMPVDPATEKSLGYCFIEYNTPQVNRYSFLGRIQCLFYHRFDEVKLQWLFQEAELAKEKTQGYKLDRSHIFSVSMFDDFDRFMKVPDEWAPPPNKEYAPGVMIISLTVCLMFLVVCCSYTLSFVLFQTTILII